MLKDLEQCKAEDAEEWRKQNGPWHAHEIKDGSRGGGSDSAGNGFQSGAAENDGVSTSPAAPPTGGVGWPASSGPHTFAPQTGGLVYPNGSMPPSMLGANCYGSGTAQSGVTNRVQNVDPEI